MTSGEPIKFPEYELNGLKFEKCLVLGPPAHDGYFIVAGDGDKPDVTQMRVTKSLNHGAWHCYTTGFRKVTWTQ